VEGIAMIEIRIGEPVQLKRDVPELGLHRGESGLVCSTWFSPAAAYEVEFPRKVPDCAVRALLLPHEIACEVLQA